MLDPKAWNDDCDGIAGLVNASGTVMIPYELDDRNAGVPRSPRRAEVMSSFIATGWHHRDFRSAGFPKAISAGCVTDQDLISVDGMRRHPYHQEWLASVGLKWFAGVRPQGRSESLRRCRAGHGGARPVHDG